MELDERKLKILKAIIQTYQDTGEPVGSRTISKYSDLKLSSATIRNEMADLEEMGFIIQPHTSAGRIPTDLGYRYYVNQLIEEKDQQVSEMKDFIIQKVDRLELLLKQMARILANNTNYATMITGPSYSNTKLKFIQLSAMDSDKLLVVVVVDGNLVKNSMVSLRRKISNQDILSLNLLLNSKLNGLSLNEINLGIIRELETQAGDYGQKGLCRCSGQNRLFPRGRRAAGGHRLDRPRRRPGRAGAKRRDSPLYRSGFNAGSGICLRPGLGAEALPYAEPLRGTYRLRNHPQALRL